VFHRAPTFQASLRAIRDIPRPPRHMIIMCMLLGTLVPERMTGNISRYGKMPKYQGVFPLEWIVSKTGFKSTRSFDEVHVLMRPRANNNTARSGPGTSSPAFDCATKWTQRVSAVFFFLRILEDRPVITSSKARESLTQRTRPRGVPDLFILAMRKSVPQSMGGGILTQPEERYE